MGDEFNKTSGRDYGELWASATVNNIVWEHCGDLNPGGKEGAIGRMAGIRGYAPMQPR